MNLIVETDIGNDPDDFFALCYLIAAGINIRCISITPGNLDQVAFARFLCKELNLDIPIASSKLNSTKVSSGGIHHQLLRKYGYDLGSKSDGLGKEIIKDVFLKYPDSEFFVIGPVTSVGSFLAENNCEIKKATMQGGFLSYNVNPFPCRRYPDFENKFWMPIFNLNGDRKNALNFSQAKIKDRRFVGKNVCHTVMFDKERFSHMKKPENRAGELFIEGMELYLQFHDRKKFHDPTAAVCHLYPEIGCWIKGKIEKMETGWGTKLDDNGDHILADINYDLLWQHIFNMN